jgi:hypothetical protein
MSLETRWKRELRILSSPIIFAIVVAFIFQSWEIGLMLTASLGIHELGHIAFIWIQRVEWELGFGAMGAWTRSSLEQRQVLSHYANSLIHLAGPSFSFVFALLAFGMFFIMNASADRVYWLLLANLNALLALLNFIPMGNLSDGGKFIKRLFASLPKREERRLLTMLVPSFFSWIALLYGMDLVRALSLGTLVLWLFISMVIESAKDDPSEAESPKAMTSQQAGVLLSIVVMLFFLSTCIVIITPFWLTEGAVLRMAEGWISLFVNIIWRSPIALRVGLVIVGFFFIYRLARRVLLRVRRNRG